VTQSSAPANAQSPPLSVPSAVRTALPSRGRPSRVELTAEKIEAFSGVYLSPRYDSPQPTPDFHRECWTRYCSSHPACATAAPRNHAKSTALTHDFILATVCFRVESYVILVGSSEELAIEHLGDIRNELSENEDLRRDFKIRSFVVEQKTDLIVECEDGYQFRIIARGAEQKIRGRKWRGMRPGLIVFDDIEDDEQVENKDRRRKFRRWFFRACKQALRDGGRIRGHGTILHQDSLLMHLIKNKSWDSKLYKAHKSYNDFREILWEEKFSKERLLGIRTEFECEGDGPGYSQEYLNDPHDNDEAYLIPQGFIPMTQEDREAFRHNYVGVDFAISKADTANRTSMTVGGKCLRNLLHIHDQRVGRLDTNEIVDLFFDLEAMHDVQEFFVEDGQIWKAIAPVLMAEMQERDKWLNITPILPIKDKKARGRPYQKRHKSGGMRYDKEADWYPEYEAELLLFTGDSEAPADDQFDSTAILARGVANLQPLEDEDQLTEEEIAFIKEAAQRRAGGEGRSPVTGY
jgi:hypothetical protein